MARGSDGKAARKKSRKEARAAEAERILNGEDDLNTFSSPPPMDGEGAAKANGASAGGDSDDDSSDGEVDAAPADQSKNKKSKSGRAKKAAAQRAAAARASRGGGGGGCADGPCCGPSGSNAGEGIKTLPLIMLIMLTTSKVWVKQIVAVCGFAGE